jgi:hypothetical protein
MYLLVLIAIASLQWLITMNLANAGVILPFDPTIFLFGNLQIICVVAVWQFINKYIYIRRD